MNVLLTSAGRRTSLLSDLRAATHRRGGMVLAGDMDGLAPALFMADEAVKLPPVLDPDYVPYLLELVRRYEIKLVVPTIDTELPVLARAATSFAEHGCRALVSALGLIGICHDKYLTVQAFRTRGIRVPASWLPEELESADLPERLFLKPRNGSASQHTYRSKRDELSRILPWVPNPIIQEEVRAVEITIDALLDWTGRPVHYVPRTRTRTIGGESIQGVTLPDDTLCDWICRVLTVVGDLGGNGPITLQAFLTDGEPTLSEINPRFGGGVPLTLAAGGDYPEWLLLELEGKTLAPRIGDYRRNLYMTRYYSELFVEGPRWP